MISPESIVNSTDTNSAVVVVVLSPLDLQQCRVPRLSLYCCGRLPSHEDGLGKLFFRFSKDRKFDSRSSDVLGAPFLRTQ